MQVCPLLVQNLDRLRDDVREESAGVHNTLSILENLVEFRAATCKEAAEAGLLNWLVKRYRESNIFTCSFNAIAIFPCKAKSSLVQLQ